MTLHLPVRNNSAARDEYILRLELHSRLASDSDLFAGEAQPLPFGVETLHPLPNPPPRMQRMRVGIIALAACLTALAVGWWMLRSPGGARSDATSRAVAMLNTVADAQWSQEFESPRIGAPLAPGPLRLTSGLAEIVFYSGARVVMEGPADLHVISANEASFQTGRYVAEVPPEARGFRLVTPHIRVHDLAAKVGLKVTPDESSLHIFKGRVEMDTGSANHVLHHGAATIVRKSGTPEMIPASAANFGSLFQLHARSSDAAALRNERWRAASRQLDEDASLLVRYDFEPSGSPEWRLNDTSKHGGVGFDGTVVGCQRVEGRWPNKRALEFGSVSDRVRFSVPGKFEALTMAAWVRVHGLDRKVNSLFMSDGFRTGTLHWLILNDGSLGLTLFGEGAGNFQIIPSRSVVSLEDFGLWLHLAVVVDGAAKRAAHYMNGEKVDEKSLKIPPPYRIGTAELGNWNPDGFQGDHPTLIRNFSGAMDEFCILNRALTDDEILALYTSGKPQLDAPRLKQKTLRTTLKK